MADFPSKRRPRRERTRRPPRPLGRTALEELALAYVARFATSAGKLEAYLKRKLRERGWDAGTDEDAGDDAGMEAVAAIVESFITNKYVDDEGYAHGRSRSLTARGYGPRRVEASLREAGIGEELRTAARPDERRQREAAVDLARKRGFGPFDRSRGINDRDDDAPVAFEILAQRRAAEEKQLAAMLRAGHSFDIARAALALRSEADAQTWIDEAEDEE